MPLIRTEAIILQVFAYSETSKVLRLLTPSHGMISVMARGARRPRSPYGGVLEPFARGSASVHLKAGRELQTLSGFDLARSGQPLGRDLVRFAAASLLAELLLRAGGEGAEAAIFRVVDRGLERLAGAAQDELESVALARLWALVVAMGYRPALAACTACGRSLAEAEDAFFDYDDGGVRCDGCGAGAGAGRRLPGAARLDLRRLCDGEDVALHRTAAHWNLFANFVRRHVVEHGELRSLDFLAAAVGQP